jgi:lipopolysaccharide export LptBFGC system permease protein LptF
MQQGLAEVIPEIIMLVLLSTVYFLIGVWFYRSMHMRSE